ncbi:hypothetical protein [Flavobacterium hungaricum]|uniref:Uncharacterized protein n=1 Tax=Flavobacterium hungaricum TaxID=2082725 RepID=A0ABR9TQH8_9FLAO|nr:hypothetical protein [Flavobacterium hungaricum]MBE8727625.1 hypothetical protein [Flavobacterium hungaricum]
MSLIQRNALLCIFILIFQNTEAKNAQPKIKDHCLEENIKIVTELKLRYKYFFFRRTSHKKVKRIDKVVNQNGKVIMKIVMKSTETNDYSWFRKFHRVVIIGEEIHEATILVNKEKGKLTIYNFCGEKIKEQNLKAEELYEKYRF